MNEQWKVGGQRAIRFQLSEVRVALSSNQFVFTYQYSLTFIIFSDMDNYADARLPLGRLHPDKL